MTADAHSEGWQIFYGDLQVGKIGIRAGVPVGVDNGAGPVASNR